MKREEKIKAWKKMRAWVRSDKFGNKDSSQDNGLCHVLNSLFWEYDMSNEVHDYVKQKLRKLKRMKDSDYVWPVGVKAPRIKWLNEQIKLLEKK